MRKRFPPLRVAMATWRRSSRELQQKTLHPEFPQATCHASVGFVAAVHRTYWSSFCGGKLPRTFGLLHQGGDETGNICLDLQQRVRRRIRKQPTNVLRHVCQKNRPIGRLCPLMSSRKGLGLMTLQLELSPTHSPHDFEIRQTCGQSFEKLRVFFTKPLPGGLFE